MGDSICYCLSGPHDLVNAASLGSEHFHGVDHFGLDQLLRLQLLLRRSRHIGLHFGRSSRLGGTPTQCIDHVLFADCFCVGISCPVFEDSSSGSMLLRFPLPKINICTHMVSHKALPAQRVLATSLDVHLQLWVLGLDLTAIRQRFVRQSDESLEALALLALFIGLRTDVRQISVPLFNLSLKFGELVLLSLLKLHFFNPLLIELSLDVCKGLFLLLKNLLRFFCCSSRYYKVIVRGQALGFNVVDNSAVTVACQATQLLVHKILNMVALVRSFLFKLADKDL
mmetsp:Transcript_40994/g.95287  ORF Transcript_40994/g.95287 Transcript_40994/m.95287 type:complete len:283 (+) Transcript_40994:934-1782(+)